MRDELQETLLAAVDLARHRDVSFLAGGIAFFAFFSIIPITVLVLAIGSLVGGEQFAVRVLSVVESYLSQEGSDILSEALADSRGLAGASAVSGVLLLWSALKVFRAIDIAFDRVYEIQSSTSLPEQLRNGLIVLLAIGAGFGLLVAVQVLLGRVGVSTTSGLLGWPAAIVGLLVVLVPLYYILPPVRQRIWTILPGTLFAVIGIVLLQQLFQIYAAQASRYQAYGLIGAVLLFLLWLYFGSLILVLGAVVNAAIADVRDGIHDEGMQGDSAPEATD